MSEPKRPTWMTEPERDSIVRLRSLFGGETQERAHLWIAKVEAEAVRAALDDLERAVEGAQGYTHGLTIDGDEVSASMEPSSDPHLGDWLQRGPLLHLITEARDRVT